MGGARRDKFSAVFETTQVPERPDDDRANAFLITALRRALSEELQ
jgi:hypothetical protein